MASSEGLTVVKFTMRPSAFEMIFCAKTKTSPSSNDMSAVLSARKMISAKSSPSLMTGMPGSVVKLSVFGLFMDTCDTNTG